MDGSVISNARLERFRSCGVRAEAAALSGAPLTAVLEDLLLGVEEAMDTPMLGSVLLLDGNILRHGAAPSLPAAYNQSIDGTEIGPAVGSCGTAAYYGEPVFVDDIKNDPVWADFRDLALTHGLRACWSTPIKDPDGRVLGTFANYYREPRHPRPADFQAIALVAEHVARVVGRDRVANAKV